LANFAELFESGSKIVDDHSYRHLIAYPARAQLSYRSYPPTGKKA
jgi:hypothetical protein